MYLFRPTFISFHKAKRTFKKYVALEARGGLTKKRNRWMKCNKKRRVTHLNFFHVHFSHN